MEEVLLVLLLDRCWKRSEIGEDLIRDGKGLLRFWSESRW